MMKKPLLIMSVIGLCMSSCAMVQSIVKSAFPYTATVTIPASAKVGEKGVSLSTANSFDQDFTKDGNNAGKVSEVSMISAKLQSKDPSGYNIGNIASIKVYLSKADGSEEVMVAYRNDITPNVGNSIVLDVDNTNFLDALVREPALRVRMVYVLRKAADVDASLKVSLGMGAYPRN